jgi:hypothetical protein
MLTEDDKQQLRVMGFNVGFNASPHEARLDYELWSRKGRSHLFAYGAPTHDFIVYPNHNHSVRIVAKTFPEAIAAYVAALLRGDTQ